MRLKRHCRIAFDLKKKGRIFPVVKSGEYQGYAWGYGCLHNM